MEVEAYLIDPRDVREEIDTPAYRVYFWKRDASRCVEYRIDPGCDVHEVLAWAASREGDDMVPVVYAETDSCDTGRRLLRLKGRQPGIDEYSQVTDESAAIAYGDDAPA